MRKAFAFWVMVLIIPFHIFSVISDHKTAFLQRKGGFYAAGIYTSYDSDEFWNREGKKRDAHNDFEKSAYTLYAEYGLTTKDTLLIKGGWARIEESINGRTFGFEDLEIGWRHYLGSKCGHLLSIEVDAIVPVDDGFKPGLRYGKSGGEINLLATKTFDVRNWRGTYDLRLGYLGYLGFPSDQLLADAVLNLNLFSKLTFTLGGFLEWGLFNGSSHENSSHFFYNPNYRLFVGQAQATFNFCKGASLFVGYNRHIWGENVGTGGSIFGGASIQF